MGCSNLFIFVFIFPACSAIQWLGLWQSPFSWNVTSHCVQASKLQHLAAVQKKACKQHLDIMPIMATVSKSVTQNCQETFRDQRWNCSSIQSAPRYGIDLISGTREQAFVHALSTAVLTSSTARSCSEGRLQSCTCGSSNREPPPGDFLWGGCADNVKYGLYIAKAFTETPFNRRKFRRDSLIRMNRHNSRAGWRIVMNAVTTQCKCHGVSGTCTVKTCWLSSPASKELAFRLKQKYEAAEEVTNKAVAGGTRWKLLPVSSTGRFNKDDLIYINKSPSYCQRDLSKGFLGTHGRTCRKTSNGKDNCDYLCCHRGYDTIEIQDKVHCNCKYRWCCYVTCSVCEVVKNVHICR